MLYFDLKYCLSYGFVLVIFFVAICFVGNSCKYVTQGKILAKVKNGGINESLLLPLQSISPYINQWRLSGTVKGMDGANEIGAQYLVPRPRFTAQLHQI